MDATLEVYNLTALLPKEEAYGLRSQLTRSMVSVPANIAEGWTRESSRDKAHFLAIAQGSLAETETLVTLCERLGWFPEAATRDLRTWMDEISRMLTVMRRNRRKVNGNADT